MDKFFSQLAADAALDQMVVYFSTEDWQSSFRLLLWVGSTIVQFMLMRHAVLKWAGLELEPQGAAGG